MSKSPDSASGLSDTRWSRAALLTCFVAAALIVAGVAIQIANLPS